VDIYELWEAKRRGKFTLKHWVWAWLISTRAVALPWVALYTLFGCLLAGVKDPVAALGAVLTVCFTLLASHFRNNYRDVELGIDRYVDDPGEAEKVVSTLKPYTAAAWLVPLRITSVGFQKANEALFLGLSAAAYALMVLPGHPETLPLYALGVFMAESYTDWWKRWRLGEAAAFLGHGFSTVAFGYLSQSNDVLAAVLAGVVPGVISAFAYSIDQIIDLRETDFIERVRSIYEAWFRSRLPLGLYMLAFVMFYYHLLTVFVILGVYPRGVLLTYTLIPLYLFVSAQVEYDRERGLRTAAVTTVILLPLLMCLGVLIS